ALMMLPAHIILLVVGGNKGMISTYAKKAAHLGIGHRVKWLGTQSAMPDFYNAADLFVLPSSAEAWPLAVIEALACGLPALVTPVGGISEFVKEGKNGVFVKQDAPSIAKSVLALSKDPDL